MSVAVSSEFISASVLIEVLVCTQRAIGTCTINKNISGLVTYKENQLD